MGKAVKLPRSCILFATADWDDPYWTNKQHCAISLAELGLPVLYIESIGLRSPKSKSSRDLRRLLRRLFKGLWCFLCGPTKRAPGIYVLSPLVIPFGHSHPLLRKLNNCFLRYSIWRSNVCKSFKSPLIWTYHPFIADAVTRYHASALLYHCVDDLAAVPGVNAEAFRAEERILLQSADVVFATSPKLQEHCNNFNSNTHYLPNVVDTTHFGLALKDSPLPPELQKIPEPRLVYHGVLSDFKIDFELIRKCAELRPDWSWILIGEQREGQQSSQVDQLFNMPNVHFLGYRPYQVLPDYLRGMQVGLLPTLVNSYTCSMFPMKFYEYLAAGLPVVSTRLDFTRDPLPRLEIAETSEAFVTKIEKQLRSRKPTPNQAVSHVGKNTWKDRTETMLRILQTTSVTQTPTSTLND